MFACLYSLTAPQSLLVKVAEDFTPRFETIGPLVMLDIAGLSRLFGTPQEIGEQLRRSMGGAPVRIAIAPSQTAAALLALGRVGLTVVSVEQQPAALAALPVTLLGELERLRCPQAADPRARPDGSSEHVGVTRGVPTNANERDADMLASSNQTDTIQDVSSLRLGVSAAREHAGRKYPPHVGEMWDALPYFQSTLDRVPEQVRAPHSNCGGGWSHPRESHAARSAKRERRVPISAQAEHPHAAQPAKVRVVLKDIAALLDVLRRWGIKTLGALAALPPGDVYERLGARGVTWQRLARGEDHCPLVPWVPEDPFEGTLDLEWPIEGLEPLSFVLARLLEPLAERLERADRGAAILHTHLRLTTKEVYARTVQLPAPMRDPKTLRTLVLLDLESNPPSAAIDRVRVLVEPTPARVLQWTLYERAQPSPEQVSTLLARLTALMGEGHVGSPTLVDSWKPGAFEMTPFDIPATALQASASARTASQASYGETSPKRPEMQGREGGPGTALRRFRLPIPARVQMQDGRPVRVMVDRRGIAGGAVEQSAGPWRTSGEWWRDGQVGLPRRSLEQSPQAKAGQVGRVGQTEQAEKRFDPPHQTYQTYPPQSWDRDEWEVLLDDGPAYRIYVERDVGQWFIEGVVD